MLKTIETEDVHPNYVRAFRKNVRWYRSLFLRQPAGWNKRTGQQLGKILDDANRYIQKLNDMYTNPSGTRPATENSSTAPDPSGPGARGGTSPE
jgi:hypothetical protein